MPSREHRGSIPRQNPQCKYIVKVQSGEALRGTRDIRAECRSCSLFRCYRSVTGLAHRLAFVSSQWTQGQLSIEAARPAKTRFRCHVRLINVLLRSLVRRLWTFTRSAAVSCVACPHLSSHCGWPSCAAALETSASMSFRCVSAFINDNKYNPEPLHNVFMHMCVINSQCHKVVLRKDVKYWKYHLEKKKMVPECDILLPHSAVFYIWI